MPPKRKPTKKQRAYETSGEKRKTEDGEEKELKKNRRQSVTEPMRSNFTRVLCRDVRVCFFEFLGPKDQASLRAVSKDSSIDFNHAAQRGYVPVVVCDEYVEDVNEIHQDGEDGHPKLHFAPGNRKNFFTPKGADYTYKMQRSEKDKNATLIVNVAKMLGKGEAKLQEDFLYTAQFKAVHFIGTESLEEIGKACLCRAQNLACFTMSTPCPKLKRVADAWLYCCSALSKVDFTGCTALESIGDGWLRNCSSLKIANLSGCSALEEVGDLWMYECKALEVLDLGACVSLKTIGKRWLAYCRSLRRVVLPSDTELPDDIVKSVKKYLE